MFANNLITQLAEELSDSFVYHQLVELYEIPCHVSCV